MKPEGYRGRSARDVCPRAISDWEDSQGSVIMRVSMLFKTCNADKDAQRLFVAAFGEGFNHIYGFIAILIPIGFRLLKPCVCMESPDAVADTLSAKSSGRNNDVHKSHKVANKADYCRDYRRGLNDYQQYALETRFALKTLSSLHRLHVFCLVCV